MTSGGITTRKLMVWAAVALFIVAILCAVESMTGGGRGYLGLALGAFVLGLITAIGSWARGLPQAKADPEHDEWMNAIR